LIFVLFSFIAGVDFRKGFIVTNIFGLTIILTVLLKNYIDYPRPLAIDSSLKNFGSEQVVSDLSPLQPQGFFESFSDELLAKTRESDIARTGLPSGHTSSQIAVWISLALLIRKRWLFIFSISIVLLTMISRIFLAQHFVGDVLGGLLLGLLVLSIMFFALQKLGILKDDKLNINQIAFFLFPLILVPFYKFLPSFQAGSIIGFNLALILILKKLGNPTLADSLIKKIANILTYFLIFVALYFASKLLGLVDGSFISLLVFILTSFTAILLSTFVSKWFNLMRFTKA
jgi:membrane-associated phospholipid phosphatase